MVTNVIKELVEEQGNLTRVNDILSELETRVAPLERQSNKAKEYLYSDTIPFLKYLKSLNYEVVILTKGNYEYQKEKIDNCSLESLYSELLVTLEHKGELSLDYKNSIFIDDNPKEILSIMKKKPKMIFRIVRDKALYSEELLDKSIPSYKSLDEIKKYFN